MNTGATVKIRIGSGRCPQDNGCDCEKQQNAEWELHKYVQGVKSSEPVFKFQQ